MISTNRSRSFGAAAVAVAALLATSVAAVQPASARPFGGGGAMIRPHGGFHGGWHGGYYGGHRHGLGVGAAVGLGVLGAAAAGVAASQYYNGYPVYPDGAHTGYGYDYYPDHGGYYGPY